MSAQPESFKVADTIASYRGVMIGTADSVLVRDTVTTIPIGVTKNEQKNAGGGNVPVALAGSLAKLFFNDTAAAGAVVGLDSSGRGITFAAVTTASYAIGILSGPAVLATGTIAEIIVMPHSNTIP